ncbi:MAG: hypothetical protein JWS12_161 [Candidatus Saccharibacteria bacterium]|nr:hypothetical protein [Candidatus Saccharibacteria bacterium]
MAIALLIIGLILFVGLVVIHEFGHFIEARRNGVAVEEFAIGFPPRIWSKRMPSGFTLSFNWLPLGGYVRLKGEHDADKTPGSLGAASIWAKIKIMVAGVVMNALAAFVLLTFLAIVGMPQLIDNQFTVARDTHVAKSEVLVGYIEPGSPAEKAGLQVRDQFLPFGSADAYVSIAKAADLPQITRSHAGETVKFYIRRNGQPLPVLVKLRTQAEVEASKKTDNPKGYLGISPTEYSIQRSTWSAPIVAAGLMKQFTVATFKGLGSAVSNLFRGHTAAASQQVSGPVGIFVILKEGSLLGYQFMLMIIAIISLTLAIMNVLPIPALDGGRLFVMLLFRVIRRPLSRRMEEAIHGTGFAVLMVLFVLITVVDVKRYF